MSPTRCRNQLLSLEPPLLLGEQVVQIAADQSVFGAALSLRGSDRRHASISVSWGALLLRLPMLVNVLRARVVEGHFFELVRGLLFLFNLLRMVLLALFHAFSLRFQHLLLILLLSFVLGQLELR